jgi:PAS domain S-box-containing protein
MDSIISASQMLSAQIDLEQLLSKMIALVMANSGAEKAVLLLRQENDWFVQARGDSSSEKYDILLNQPLDLTDRETDFIPESIFNYCRRSKEVLVVGNAKLDQRFGQDRTIQKHHVLSLACIPILSQGKLKAMLYLENCQLAYVFTPERQQVIIHLSAQFGISVENAMLYDRLNSKKRELEVSETRFRSLVENAEETIVVAQDDLLKYANEKVEELSGYSVEEMTKMEFEKFIHPDDLNTIFSEYQVRLSGEKPASKYSIRIISKQGQTKYVYVNSARIDWDGRPATLALITDITQLKKVESDLRISKERYELAVTGSDAGIWDYNLSTGEIYYSDRFKELLGYEPHEMNDHTPEQAWNRLHPDFREIAPLKLNKHLEKQTPYYHIDYLVQTKSGEYRWFQSHGKAVWDENGNPIRVAGSFVDIHDQKNTEEEVRQAYDEIKALKDQLQAESEYLQQEIKLEHNFETIIGQSEALKYVLSRVEKVAPTDSPALIMGETGTGKELIARVIHQLSPRSNRAMVKVNCAALPAELIESELFGREKGAFTGASTAQAGRFELASGSTLFLDEIGELPLMLQAKLLRVLESGEFERLGSSRTLHSDARIIAATNRELEEEVHKGHFRDDLWYRLKVFPITVPPLRERPEDIPLLFQSFLEDLCKKMGKSLPKISSHDMQLLQKHPWPGNVRELRHSIESALINADRNKLTFELPKIANSEQTGFKSFDEMERDCILRVLKAKQWRIGGANGAASALDLNVNTLRGKMTKLGIKKPPPR